MPEGVAIEATTEMGVSGTVKFEATDVTGTVTMAVSDIQRTLPAGAVAQALAAKMELPDNVPWTLRKDSSGAYLDDESPIGDQLGEIDEKLTVAPKAHLG